MRPFGTGEQTTGYVILEGILHLGVQGGAQRQKRVRKLIELYRRVREMSPLGTGVTEIHHQMRGNLLLHIEVPLLCVAKGFIWNWRQNALPLKYVQQRRVVSNRWDQGRWEMDC